jgi:hypothetical protein
MSEILYTEQSGSTRNAYRENAKLVLLRGNSLPDVCVACGNPARGNVMRKKLPEVSLWFWLSPPGFDFILDLIFAKRYVFEFPFCPNCPPGRFRLTPARLDEHLAIFVGTCQTLLDLLPPLPPDVAVEKNLTWFRRRFRRLYE